jgi:hypothetical protein
MPISLGTRYTSSLALLCSWSPSIAPASVTPFNISVKSRLSDVGARMFQIYRPHCRTAQCEHKKYSTCTAKFDLFTPPVCLRGQKTRPQSEHRRTHTIASGTQRLIVCSGATAESCAHCFTSHGYCPQVPHLHKVTLQHNRYDTPTTQHSVAVQWQQQARYPTVPSRTTPLWRRQFLTYASKRHSIYCSTPPPLRPALHAPTSGDHVCRLLSRRHRNAPTALVDPVEARFL